MPMSGVECTPWSIDTASQDQNANGAACVQSGCTNTDNLCLCPICPHGGTDNRPHLAVPPTCANV